MSSGALSQLEKAYVKTLEESDGQRWRVWAESDTMKLIDECEHMRKAKVSPNKFENYSSGGNDLVRDVLASGFLTELKQTMAIAAFKKTLCCARSFFIANNKARELGKPVSNGLINALVVDLAQLCVLHYVISVKKGELPALLLHSVNWTNIGPLKADTAYCIEVQLVWDDSRFFTLKAAVRPVVPLKTQSKRSLKRGIKKLAHGDIMFLNVNSVKHETYKESLLSML